MFRRADHRARQQIIASTQILVALDHQIHAMLKGPDVIGRAKGGVDNGQQAVTMGDLGQPGQVRHCK